MSPYISVNTRQVFMNLKMFENFYLSEAVLRAACDEGYRQPADVQRAAIPEILAGKDLIATAQTGTGKTAAFCLPMLDMLHRRQRNGLRALVLTPTRELALQTDASQRACGRYLPLRISVVPGGVSVNGQVNDLRKGPDPLVATPRRLLGLASDLLSTRPVQQRRSFSSRGRFGGGRSGRFGQ
jgi:ATP-dependent RNA helicase RhlE